MDTSKPINELPPPSFNEYSDEKQARMQILWAFCEDVRLCLSRFGPDDRKTIDAKERLRLVFRLLKVAERLEPEYMRQAETSSRPGASSDRQTRSAAATPNPKGVHRARSRADTDQGDRDSYVLSLSAWCPGF